MTRWYVYIGRCWQQYAVDPAANESEVANNGLIISWSNGKITSPYQISSIEMIQTLKALKPHLLKQGLAMVEQYAPDVVRSLENL
ncbi:ANM_HP_G0242940.mRNA.1.CDS.1 [Saccharomyces cerevisiae]|nr:ANM_HP_G0242940.mRNA.1.CDS.1 [Saccharomyces cerevisiae]CAI7002530.1 ANM_HP_G0242940.mRNA.1.CDS.1 [Saccharomyces cerevisiae]